VHGVPLCARTQRQLTLIVKRPHQHVLARRLCEQVRGKSPGFHLPYWGPNPSAQPSSPAICALQSPEKSAGIPCRCQTPSVRFRPL